jgi:hypothetical protein
MAQHDQNIADGSGSTVRADINNAIVALFSHSSGGSAPSPTVAYQTWADTSAGFMRQRNASNTAWVTLYTLATGATAHTGTATVQATQAEMVDGSESALRSMSPYLVGKAVQAYAAAFAAENNTNPVYRTNPQVIDSDTTIPAETNGFSIGPITVSDGVTLTVADGANYVIL